MEKQYIKDFDKWNEYAKKLNNKNAPSRFKEKEIWWCALGVNIGSEQDGKNEDFERPVLIIRRINSEMLIVVPITSTIKNHKDRVDISFLGKDSQLLLQQVRIISSKRLLRKVSIIKLVKYLIVILGIIRCFSGFQQQGETPQ